MANGSNGDLHTPIRSRTPPTTPGAPGANGRALPGRAVVVAGGLAVLLIWGMLYLAFLDWRRRHLERVAFGRERVVAAVAPMARLEPPGVDPGEYRAAVSATADMLDAVVASGLLDRPRLAGLADEIRERAAAATPETAVATLRGIWDDIEARAGPVLARTTSDPSRHSARPALLADPAPATVP